MTASLLPDLALLLLFIGLVWWWWILRRGKGTDRSSGPGSKADETEDLLPRPAGGYRAFLRQSGLDPTVALLSYAATKLFLVAFVPLVWLLALPPGPERGFGDPWIWGAAVVGFFLPDLWLWRVRGHRRRQIRNALSYFIDLMVALLHSGLNLEQAFNRAAREGFSGSHPLAREASIIGRELEMGKDRSQAFRALADRTGVTELRPVAAAMSMSAGRGTSVVEALEAQADLLRDQRRERALRRVYTSGVVAVLPILLCGLPIFAVIVYFPAWLRLMETLRVLQAF